MDHDPMSGFGNFGERATAAIRDWGFYAHLSIYDFAVAYCANNRVLDVGCGTGYGIRHIKDHGAVAAVALERDAEMVAVLVRENPDIQFITCDLNDGKIPLKKGSFDVAFSSNVLEHIVDVDPLLMELCRVLADDGIAIIAVPPIPNVDVLRLNAKNIFHVNNLTHGVWVSKLCRFFHQVKSVRHWMLESRVIGGPDTFNRENVDVKDFTFLPYLSEEDYTQTITSIYVCRAPRTIFLPKSDEEGMPVEWQVTRTEAEGRQEAFLELSRQVESQKEYWRGEWSLLREWMVKSQSENLPPSEIIDHALSWIKSHLD